VFPNKLTVVPENEEEQVGLINGRKPGSVEEWRVAVALWDMDATFEFQYKVKNQSPRGVRGFFLLDFYIDANPKPVALEVQSRRWHSAQFSPDEKLRIALIENVIKSPIYFVWGFELKDQQQANEAVRKEIGHLI